jgi:hypothetical protein
MSGQVFFNPVDQLGNTDRLSTQLDENGRHRNPDSAHIHDKRAACSRLAQVWPYPWINNASQHDYGLLNMGGLIVSAVAGSNVTDKASKYESNARSFQGELLFLQ